MRQTQLRLTNIALISLLVLTSLSFSGQSSANNGLTSSLNDLDAEIARAKTKLEQLKSVKARNAKEHKQDLQTLASQIVTESIEVEKKKQELQKLDDSMPKLQAELELARRTWKSNLDRLRRSATGLKHLLKEQPGRSTEISRLQVRLDLI